MTACISIYLPIHLNPGGGLHSDVEALDTILSYLLNNPGPHMANHHTTTLLSIEPIEQLCHDFTAFAS